MILKKGNRDQKSKTMQTSKDQKSMETSWRWNSTVAIEKCNSKAFAIPILIAIDFVSIIIKANVVRIVIANAIELTFLATVKFHFQLVSILSFFLDLELVCIVFEFRSLIPF